MSRTALRPVRLIRITDDQPDQYVTMREKDIVRKARNKERTAPLQQDIRSLEMAPETPMPLMPEIPTTEVPQGETEAQHLLKRTPHSYLLNQAYGLWFFLSAFLMTIVVTRALSPEQYGIYAIVLTAYNTILYIVAFGMEDATTTYIPRVFAEYGKASAASLTRRLLLVRAGVLVATTLVILFGLPALAWAVDFIPAQSAVDVAASLRNPELLTNLVPIAIYVLGSSVGSLLNAVCAALMRMQIVFVIGSLSQLALLIFSYVVLQLGWGINGVLWLLAITSVVGAVAFALWLAPFLFARGATHTYRLTPLLKLGISAWLTNLVTGALFKQVSIILLGAFAVSLIGIGYFNLAFQLADAANLLFVAGFGGVAGAALAAAFVGTNYDRLSLSWQALIKIETLLAAPGLIFCIFNATGIMQALYGAGFGVVGPLLAIFLFFNILDRILGRTIHQYALYVTERARLVVLSQWIGMGVVVVLGALLIGYFQMGAAGALIADGIAKITTGGLQLFFLWKAMPHKFPLAFTLRYLLALIIPAAALSFLWRPNELLWIFVLGCIFMALCLGLLFWIKPLNTRDIEMIQTANPRIAAILRYFMHTEAKARG